MKDWDGDKGRGGVRLTRIHISYRRIPAPAYCTYGVGTVRQCKYNPSIIKNDGNRLYIR